MQSHFPHQANPVTPLMPWFEPSDEPSAKALLLSQTVTEGAPFMFPANRDFWNNFVQEAHKYPGALDPPHYHVDASHTDQSVLVNQEFVRSFVSGWEKANPHLVTVSTPYGASTFHSSEEFWNRFVTMAGQRNRGGSALEDTTVTSKMLPNTPIKTTEEVWNDICRTWALEKCLGEWMSMPSPSAPPRPEFAKDTAHAAFPVDRRFWSSLMQEMRKYPGAKDPPHYQVDASHTDVAVHVNQEFLKCFMAGWEKREESHVLSPPVPQMPWFELSGDSVTDSVWEEQPFQISFLKERNLRGNLVLETRRRQGAMDPPYVELAELGLRVNAAFLRLFVSSWCSAHPHTVTVSTPLASSSFRANEVFWPWFVGRASEMRRQCTATDLDTVENTTVSSTAHSTAVTTTETGWREMCYEWAQVMHNT